MEGDGKVTGGRGNKGIATPHHQPVQLVKSQCQLLSAKSFIRLGSTYYSSCNCQLTVSMKCASASEAAQVPALVWTPAACRSTDHQQQGVGTRCTSELTGHPLVDILSRLQVHNLQACISSICTTLSSTCARTSQCKVHVACCSMLSPWHLHCTTLYCMSTEHHCLYIS
jgi:hypothetical protein